MIAAVVVGGVSAGMSVIVTRTNTGVARLDRDAELSNVMR